MTGILAPAPQQFCDDNGNPLSNAKIFFYAPGGTTKQNTWGDAALSTLNANPVRTDADGRPTSGAIYLDPSLGYKRVISPSTDTDPPTNPIETQDNYYLPSMVLPQVLSKVAADSPYTVTTADGFDVLIECNATAGAMTVIPYTAVGNAGKRITVKKTDASANAITIDPNGSQTIDGSSTASLTSQYASVTIESNGANWDKVSTVSAAASSSATPMVCEGRLTATTAVPVTTADVSAATSIFFTPYKGNRIALYDGSSAWNTRTFAELTISLVGLTASKPYDIFAYDNAGTVTIETLVWTSATVRATALTLQDGVLVKTGSTTRRYLGTVYINASGGQTDDTYAKRYVWNYYNRVRRPMRVLEATDSWTYNTTAYRQANAAAANQLDLVVGVAEVAIEVEVIAHGRNDTNSDTALSVSIGEDSTTTSHASAVGRYHQATVITRTQQIAAVLNIFPAVGRHFYAWLEYSDAAGTSTWYGDGGLATLQSGIFGFIEG